MLKESAFSLSVIDLCLVGSSLRLKPLLMDKIEYHRQTWYAKNGEEISLVLCWTQQAGALCQSFLGQRLDGQLALGHIMQG